MNSKFFSLCILILLSSCAGYRVTKFNPNALLLGTNKNVIVEKFGTPFKTDRYVENDKKIEVIYYKEAVDVSSYTYILTTILTFEDNLLVKVNQKEDPTPDKTIIQTD